MASFTKRGDKWRVQVYDGRGKRKTATFRTKAEARVWALHAENEPAVLPRQTLAKVMTRYKEEVVPLHKGASWELVRLNAMARLPLAEKAISDITATDIAEWRDYRLTAVQPASVAREWNLLSQVFESARRDWGLVHTNPMADVRRPPDGKPRSRRISEDEANRVCLALGWSAGEPANASQRIAVMFLLALETAMRSGELCALSWDRTHLSRRFVSLDTSKNNDGRDVPLSSRAVELIELLPGRKGLLFDVDDHSRDTLFRKGMRRTGIEDMTFHDTRHEAITRLARKLDILDLSRMTGHKDLKMLRRYYNPTAEEIASRLA